MSLIPSASITEYIPQRDPIVMVSSLEQISEDGKVCETTLRVDSNNIFVENEFLNESGLTEHMAQSAALKAGYYFKQRNEPIPIGYIGKITELRVLKLPRLGSTVRTKIKETMQFGQATVVDAQVFDQQELIASAQLNIYTQT